MNTANHGSAAPGTYRVARTISMAMLASVFIYGGLVYLLKDAAPTLDPGQGLWILRPLLYVLAAATQLLLPVLVAAVERQSADAETGEPIGPQTRLVARTVAMMALAEAPAIWGLVLFFLFHTVIDFVLLAAFSVALILRRWPCEDDWRRLETDLPSAQPVHPE